MLQITLTNRKTADSKAYKFSQNTVLLGRHQNCDIILDSSAVSRKHAKITINKNLLEIEDLGSGNGTFVNKTKIAANEKIPFSPDDQIRIDEFEMSFSWEKKKLSAIGAQVENENASTNDESLPDLIEVRMIKKVLGALDQDKFPSLSVVGSEHNDKKVFFDEGKTELSVGRESECDLSIPSSDMSRRHAIVSIKWGGYVVTDLSSKNGTFVNGEKVKESSIKDGDEIVFGTIKTIFKNPQEFDINSISQAITEEKKAKLEETSSFDISALKENKTAPQKTDSENPEAKEKNTDTKPPETEPAPTESDKNKEQKDKADSKENDKAKKAEEDQNTSENLDDLMPEKEEPKARKKLKAKMTFSEVILFLFGGLVMLAVIFVLLYIFW